MILLFTLAITSAFAKCWHELERLSIDAIFAILINQISLIIINWAITLFILFKFQVSLWSRIKTPFSTQTALTLWTFLILGSSSGICSKMLHFLTTYVLFSIGMMDLRATFWSSLNVLTPSLLKHHLQDCWKFIHIATASYLLDSISHNFKMLHITIYVTKYNLAISPKDFIIDMNIYFFYYHPWYLDR